MPQHSPSSSAVLRTAPALPERVERFLDLFACGPGTVPALDAGAELAPGLERMQTIADPFICATVDDFLPANLYQAVLRDWPEASSFQPVATFATLVYGEPRSYFGSRMERTVENWAADATPDAPTWQRLRNALCHPDFVRALFTRFAETIDANLAGLDLDELNAPNFKLYTNLDAGSDEALGAHVDAPSKLLTIVVYLDLQGPELPDSADRWGTALYEVGPGDHLPQHFTANADRTAARNIQFAPNRAFIMPNSARALHGVVGGEAAVQRRTLMCGYWLTRTRRQD
ncbi:hypothetical protein OOK44_35690 [Streptomyces cellulosae]|uniref:2OG-Fe(II) oxygenase n=1 Tax=Streptomyces althioticus TaxID=83380 RepID=A0ABZ1YFV7_9ACTN|nr:hypothetical protein [Streptomyces cellulosae]WTB93344.1 hypothetical protein OIE99_34440 [Streptomyces cellulosae]WTC60736.1 hypothetical protein OH715_36195 [Streptomyces cellulosae]